MRKICGQLNSQKRRGWGRTEAEVPAGGVQGGPNCNRGRFLDPPEHVCFILLCVEQAKNDAMRFEGIIHDRAFYGKLQEDQQLTVTSRFTETSRFQKFTSMNAVISAIAGMMGCLQRTP
jgi:hypothetical protein